MKVKIDTSKYESSHQRKPIGRGGWIFAFGKNPEDQTTWRNFNGTYTEAKKLAKEAAQKAGVSTIYVLP